MDLVLQSMDPDKRDKVINAAIEEFSLYPYDKASTNEIVKKAEISKGLLFHYFGTKKYLYEKLIDFVIHKLYKEIVSQIDWEETDIFVRIKSLVMVKVRLGQVFPQMFDFVIKVLQEHNTKSVEDVKTLYEKYGIDFQNLLNDIYVKNIDFSLFRDPGTIDKSINIVRWVLEQYSIESFIAMENEAILDFEKISNGLDEYIHLLKKIIYK